MENPIDPANLPAQERETAEVHKSANKRNLSLLFAGWIAAIAVLALAIFAVGIYRLKWQGPVIQKIEAVVPYPAAMVNGRILSIYEFNSRFDAYKKAITYNQAFDFNDPTNAPIVSQQRAALLDRMIDLKFEAILAAKTKISVTDAEIETEMQNLYAQTGNKPEDIDQLLTTVYGWTKQEFVNQVVMPQILESKLQKALVSDKKENSEAYALAQGIKDKLDAGGDFATLAKENSSDASTKDRGGDLGWAAKGVFVPEFERAVFAMQPNQISDIIPSQFGLHIIQVLEAGKDENSEPKVHARHILLPTKDFAKWLSDEKSKATIWKFSVN